MVNCQSLANYNICTCKYIEHIRNDTCLTSSRDCTCISVEIASISHYRADLGKKVPIFVINEY